MGIHIDGLVQERRNSSALAMELRLSCINPAIYTCKDGAYFEMAVWNSGAYPMEFGPSFTATHWYCKMWCEVLLNGEHRMEEDFLKIDKFLFCSKMINWKLTTMNTASMIFLWWTCV